MTPFSLDIDTSKGLLGDERVRAIEKKARDDAGRQTYDPPEGAADTYWEQCREYAEGVVYKAQFLARTERLKRVRERTAIEGMWAMLKAMHAWRRPV